jgi:DNA-directed RNA polymerase specialized sigma24 family protein
MSPALYRDIVRSARRYARRPADAVDLAHDVILSALRQGVEDWDAPSRRAWIAGALRRHAAFVARTEIRRRGREQLALAPAPAAGGKGWSDAFLGSLAPGVRRTAVLLAAGMTRREAAYVLGISDDAFRQRVAALRRAARAHPATAAGRVAAPLDLAVGRLRQWLLGSVRRDPGVLLGTHDPDGHLLVIRKKRSRTAPSRQQGRRGGHE